MSSIPELTKEERREAFLTLMGKGLPKEHVRPLCDRLDDLGFFDAPASTRYHGNYAGGLFDHSYAVTGALLDLTERMDLDWKRPESPYLIGMLHDLCKTDQYVFNEEDRQWEYAEDIASLGHAVKSLFYIKTKLSIDLTEEETACIRWHMGAYTEKSEWTGLNKAIKKYPNVLFTHTADMIASQVKGI